MRQIKYMNLCGQFHDKIHSAGRWSQIYHVDALNPLSLHWSLPRPNCQKKLLPRWKLRRWSTMGINFSQHLLRNYITWINSLLLTYLLGKLVGCGWQSSWMPIFLNNQNQSRSWSFQAWRRRKNYKPVLPGSLPSRKPGYVSTLCQIQKKQLQILTIMAIFMMDMMMIFPQASTTEGCSTGRSAAFKRSQQCKVVRIAIIWRNLTLWL